jgi:methyl halide transferase
MTQEQNHTPRDAAYWQAIYEDGDTGWDKGEPAPPLVRVIHELDLTPGTRILVPGCGFGHEVFHLAGRGFQVTAVDFAEGAIHAISARKGDLPITALHRDLFSLDQDHASAFDVVLEHTCFCAIPVNMRDAYAQIMNAVLAEKGRIVGLFYETDCEDGPPHKTTRADIDHHFSTYFEIARIEQPHDSFENRQGNEWLVELRKR